ncbi:hypothetical protein DRW41_10580 [Neobacillus piezotolerans]|uniref:Glycosyltransferase 2-like domain-containing protein n=1 Tax=Neobacillus piezotolerans TaxID=2259171 RepID=A0A3D8GRL1_9BACI|nr:glycosyltransferase family 2 protein [Neobacillus piezotolerans]RDU37120.1 hypothetical protein DRW41_10580 [Neobacillus piezotolerans]
MKLGRDSEHAYCYSLFNLLNENINNFKMETFEYEKLVEIITDFFNKCDVHRKGENKYLKTLSQLIFQFLEGKVSEDVLRFYLEKQFDIRKSKELDNLIINIKHVLKKKGQVYTKMTFSNTFNYPKVSIIITTYNRKNYLVQALNSLLSQDYPNLEIIIIDDNSLDGTELMVKEYFCNEPRVIYIKKEKNCGPGNNRREAFELFGNGEYILFLDDDDYLVDMNYISKAIKFHIDHPEVSFVAANVFLERTIKKQLEISILGLGKIVNKNNYLLNFEKKGYPKPASTLTTVFKRDCLVEMGILNMNMVNDASIYLRSLLVGHAGFIDSIVGVYRIHGENITFNLSREFLIQNLNEKIIIKNMAVDQYGYDLKDMNDWLDFNAYKTISYYLSNSAKRTDDFKYIYNWVRENRPGIYGKLKREFQLVPFKKFLLRFKLVIRMRKKLNIFFEN